MCLWPARRGSLANAGSQLPVHDAHDCRLITSDRRAQLGRRRNFYKPNAPSIEQRHDLVQAVLRRICRDDGEDHLVLFAASRT